MAEEELLDELLFPLSNKGSRDREEGEGFYDLKHT